MTDPYASFASPVGAQSPAPQRQAPRRAPRPAAPQIRFADDRDALVRTVIGEAAGEPPEGQVAVASVINNRARNRNMTPQQIVLERNQFEPWGTADSANRLMAIRPDDARYIAASAAVDRALGGESPVGNADHFFAPRAQAALGRDVPDWAQGREPIVLGNHNFYDLGGSTEDFRQVSAPMPASDGADPYADIAAPVAVQPETGYKLPPGVVDWNTLNDEQRSQLGPGSRVLVPHREGEDYRQIVTLTGAPFTDGNTRSSDIRAGGVNLREENLQDSSRAMAMAAAERIPMLDEAAVATAGLINGRGYSATRDVYQGIQESDNQVNRDARIAGGVLGTGLSMALVPGGAGFIGRGAGVADKIGRGILVGAPLGAGIGFGEGEGSATDRVGSTLTGALGGAIGGGIGVGAMEAGRAVAPRVMSGLSEAGSRVLRGFGVQPQEAVITPDATTAAQQYVQRFVDRAGRDIASDPVAAMGKPITAAEAIGPNAVSQVTALTRRAGRAGELAQDQLGARARAQQSRVIQDFADLTGADPQGSAEAVSNLAAAGRRRAAPLYAAAYAEQVQPTPLMEDILRRPTGRAALRKAYRLAQDEGRNPEELGLFVMERPRGGVRSGPVVSEADLAADLTALRDGRRTQGAGRGKSLLEFIADSGGVRDDGDELSTMGADVWNRQGAWRRRVVTENGTDLETMARRAYDAGYFPEIVDATADSAENYQRVSTNDILDAIADELRGTQRFAREAGDTDRSAAAMLRKARREALDERLNREGIDLSKVDNATAARLIREADDAEARATAFLRDDAPGEPEIDLVPGAIPSMQTLDYVKRGMDDVLNGFRDSTTQRLNITGESRAVLDNVTAFRDELVRATGGDQGTYAQALAAGGEPIRLEGAFKEARRLFFTADERRFNQRVAQMGEAERGGLLAGLADDLYNRAQRGRLNARELRTPAFRNKLTALIGPERGDQFLARIEAEIGMAGTGGRMAPGSNSITAEVLEAMRQQDGETGFGADLARGIEQGGVKSGFVGAVGRAIASPFAGFVRGAQSPAPIPVRDEIARLLLATPDDMLQELLAARQGRPPVAARPNRSAVATALGGSSLVSSDRR